MLYGFQGWGTVMTKFWRQFKRFRYVTLAIAMTLVVSLQWQPVIAQFPSLNPDTEERQETPKATPQAQQTPAVPVVLAGETLFEIQVQVGAESVPQRAESISEAIQDFAASRFLTTENLELQPSEDGTAQILLAGDRPLFRITAKDAEAYGSNLDTLAAEYKTLIAAKVELYRKERSFEHLVEGVIKTAIASFVLVLWLIALKLIFPKLYLSVAARRKHLPAFSLGSRQIISGNRIAHLLGNLLHTLRLALTLGFLGIYFAFVLRLFPWTKIFGRSLWRYLVSALNLGWNSFVAYLPNLFVVIMIYLITSYSLKFIKPIFNELGEERIAIAGFYPEWAEPTYRLIEIFALCLSAVLMFPYLPGFGSPAFQGVSIFVGVLVSLGSTAAVSNAVAGIILIYTRAFQIGDRIKVGETFGNVEEKLLLVTRIRTFENTIVTIPNAVMIASNIVNYSVSMRDTQVPVRIKGLVTLGYDVPWRLVYQTLTAAAMNTQGVVTEMAPVVLQTALNDFSVTYELQVCIHDPQQIELIYSELYQNMQDYCNQAGIEILSPTYAAMRDGNYSTMPEDYLPDDYQAPGFNLHPLGNLFQVDLKMNNGKK